MRAPTPAPAADTVTADSAGILGEIRDLLRVLASPLLDGGPRRALVNQFQSAASATSVSLQPYTRASLVRGKRIIYSVPAAATLVIGTRSIPLPTGAGFLDIEDMAIAPADVISLTIGAAGALHLELTAWTVSPVERLEVVR